MNIIITGASRGIGYELAKKFMVDGTHQIVAIARNSLKLEQLSSVCAQMKSDARLFCLPFDLQEQDYQSQLIPFIKKHLGTVDILINNAGLLINKPILEMDDDDFDQVFGVNVKSVFKLVRDLIPYFNPSAHIVNISSMGGVQGSVKFPGLAVYSASKGAVSILTECLAEELKEEGIKVNALAIGSVQTEMLSQAFPDYEAPLKAEEMAILIARFALSGHHFFNGKILPVSTTTP